MLDAVAAFWSRFIALEAAVLYQQRSCLELRRCEETGRKKQGIEINIAWRNSPIWLSIVLANGHKWLLTFIFRRLHTKQPVFVFRCGLLVCDLTCGLSYDEGREGLYADLSLRFMICGGVIRTA